MRKTTVNYVAMVTIVTISFALSHTHTWQVSKLLRHGANVLQAVQISEAGGPGMVTDFALAAFKLVCVMYTFTFTLYYTIYSKNLYEIEKLNFTFDVVFNKTATVA